MTPEYTAYLLHTVGATARRMLAIMEPTNQRYSLGPRGASMLTLIDHGSVHPAELAETGVARSLITAEINRLLAAGLVAREESAGDKRRATLSLTPLGKTVSAESFRTILQAVEGSLARCSEQARNLLLNMLIDLSGQSATGS
ncbi:MAG: MarR family winged helix-turn-helix transcriptional regulator [Pseudomonadota bacterium]|nr:MarR family winged helix-turn-helix transcriptional regulator [Pseudomonadota bacterium]